MARIETACRRHTPEFQECWDRRPTTIGVDTHFEKADSSSSPEKRQTRATIEARGGTPYQAFVDGLLQPHKGGGPKGRLIRYQSGAELSGNNGYCSYHHQLALTFDHDVKSQLSEDGLQSGFLGAGMESDLSHANQEKATQEATVTQQRDTSVGPTGWFSRTKE